MGCLIVFIAIALIAEALIFPWLWIVYGGIVVLWLVYESLMG